MTPNNANRKQAKAVVRVPHNSASVLLVTVLHYNIPGLKNLHSQKTATNNYSSSVHGTKSNAGMIGSTASGINTYLFFLLRLTLLYLFLCLFFSLHHNARSIVPHPRSARRVVRRRHLDCARKMHGPCQARQGSVFYGCRRFIKSLLKNYADTVTVPFYRIIPIKYFYHKTPRVLY